MIQDIMNGLATTHIKFTINDKVVYEGSNIITDIGIYEWINNGLGSNVSLGIGERVVSGGISSLSNIVTTQTGVWESKPSTTESGMIIGESSLTMAFGAATADFIFSELGIHDNNPLRLQTYLLLRGDSNEVGIVVREGELFGVEYSVKLSLPMQETKSIVVMEQPVLATNTVRDANNIHRKIAHNSTTLSVRGYVSPKGIPLPNTSITGASLATTIATQISGKRVTVMGPTWYGKEIQLIEYGKDGSTAIGGSWHFEPAILWPSKDKSWNFIGSISNE